MTFAMLERLKNLTDEQKSYVQIQYAGKEKQLSTAYLLLFFMGAHYIYMGKVLKNIIYWLTLGGFGIWMLIDIFRMKTIIDDGNEEIFKKILSEALVLYPNTK